MGEVEKFGGVFVVGALCARVSWPARALRWISEMVIEVEGEADEPSMHRLDTHDIFCRSRTGSP